MKGVGLMTRPIIGATASWIKRKFYASCEELLMETLEELKKRTLVLVFDHPLNEDRYYHWRSGTGVAPMCEPSIDFEDGKWIAMPLRKAEKDKVLCPRCDTVVNKLAKGWSV